MRCTIDEMIQMPEGQILYCKSSFIEPKALAKTIAAMANAAVGLLVVGVSDKLCCIAGKACMCFERSAIGAKRFH